MTRTDTSGWPCPMARTADLIGDGWTLLIMREACLGTRRFEEFQRTLGVGRNILTVRLNMLVDEGLLRRVPYQERPVRHEYRLTDKGRNVYPILAAMATFLGRPPVRAHPACPGPSADSPPAADEARMRRVTAVV